MFHISMQASEKANSKLELYPLTLEQLGSATSVVEKGSKLGKGFIRGKLNGPERCNEYLEYSRLLVIDGDGGINDKPTPNAEHCHQALKDLGYNHVLYTTHSHTSDYHKYRVVIEMSEDIKEHELHVNMSRLMEELYAQGVYLKYVSEMDTWSQIWFFPRRDNPDDGEFIHLEYHDGGLFETIHVEKEQAEKTRKEKVRTDTSSEAQTLDELFTNIYNGIEVHPSLRNLSYQLAKDGVSRPLIISQLRAALANSKIAGTERWEQRDKDLERLIDGGIKRAEDEITESSDFNIQGSSQSTLSYTPPPMPPGRVGKAIEQCMGSMARPQIEFAFPMIFGSIAAICGAKFNGYTNEYTGLNINMTIVAGTGFGKGQISKFYNSLFIGGLGGKVINLSGGEGAMSFLGTNNYTAPKPLHQDLMKGRSKIVCMQEAGIMLGAKSGNADELSAYVMENYVNSAHNQFSSSRSYSQEENSLRPFRAPAMSLVLESTEESLAEALKGMNAVSSGYIPRQTMFKVVGKPKMRRSRDSAGDITFDEDIYHQYKLLISAASPIQATSDFDHITVALTDEQFDDYCDICDMYAESFPDDMARDIATRMAHKIVKFACLATVFNSWKSGDIEVDQDCWEWAKSMGGWEMEHLNHNLSYMKSENSYDDAMKFIAERMIVSLNHKDTTQKQRDAKMITKRTLFNRLYVDKNNSARGKIATIAADRKMGVIQFVEMNLKAMERSGFIKLHESQSLFRKGTGIVIQILEGINVLLSKEE